MSGTVGRTDVPLAKQNDAQILAPVDQYVEGTWPKYLVEKLN